MKFEKYESYLICEECQMRGDPQPEADGSSGLVKGWFHYHPDYFPYSLELCFTRRVDFCSAECRDKWIARKLSSLQRFLAEYRVVYQFTSSAVKDWKDRG